MKRRPPPIALTVLAVLGAAACVAFAIVANGCVAVQRPDGGTGLAFGITSETAAAAVSSVPGGEVLTSLLGLGGATTTTGAYAAYLMGKNKGWDERAKEAKPTT